MSLYERAIVFILHHIETKKLEEGAKLPTEPELAAMAGVSMVTVRRALAELAAQGIVRREQGRGTFLNRPRINAETMRVGSLRAGLNLSSNSTLETELLGTESRGATAEEASRLNIPQSASVWEIARLRLLNGRPMVHEVSIVPAVLAPDLGNCFEQDPLRPLYATLEQVFGLREVRSEQSQVSRPADQADRKLLRMPKGEWVVEIAGVSFSNRNIAFDRFRMVFEARGFSFKLGAASAMAAVEVER